MTDFERALKFVFEHEVVFAPGHYGSMEHVISEKVSGDRGALTKWGIDQASHPEVDIESLTQTQAAQIYSESYWLPCHADELPWPLSLAHFDAAVNTGIVRANKMLQRAVEVSEDGIFGPVTRAAVDAALEEYGSKAIGLQISDLRREFYVSLASASESQKKFLNGWLNRVTDLESLINEQA